MFGFQFSRIQDLLTTNGVPHDLLKFVSNVNPETIFSDKYSHAFNLSVRQSADALTREYCKTVADAYSSFSKAVSAADEKFLSNITECSKADNVLGTTTSTSALEQLKPPSQHPPLKDGTKYLMCPVMNCSSGSFKLRRHIRSAHPHLNEYQINYGFQLARKLYLNDARDINVSQEVCAGKDARRKCTFNYRYKKGNPRRCLTCNKLYMNVADHLINNHKLVRESAEYVHKLRNAPVIPKCYTKTVRGEIVELTGDELEAAKAMYDVTVQAQTVELQTIRKVGYYYFTVVKPQYGQLNVFVYFVTVLTFEHRYSYQITLEILVSVLPNIS